MISETRLHTSTAWLTAEIVVIGVVLAFMAFLGYPSFLPYPWHKCLHILGAVIFLGNIIVTGVWMFLAERNGDARTLHFAATAVNWADVFFTTPGIALLVVNGMIMVKRWGGVGTSWVAAALGLFVLSGIIWAAFLLRYQNRLIRLSTPRGPTGELPEEFFRTLHRWYGWGVAATIIPLLSLVLMVVKPRLW